MTFLSQRRWPHSCLFQTTRFLSRKTIIDLKGVDYLKMSSFAHPHLVPNACMTIILMWRKIIWKIIYPYNVFVHCCTKQQTLLTFIMWTFFKVSSVVFHVRKKNIQIWNDMVCEEKMTKLNSLTLLSWVTCIWGASLIYRFSCSLVFKSFVLDPLNVWVSALVWCSVNIFFKTAWYLENIPVDFAL